MVRVLLADPQVMSRKGWVSVFSETRDLRVCGECGDCEGTLTAIQSKKPDVVILDPAIADQGGMDFLKELRKSAGELPVLVHTDLREAEYGPRALKAGAAGFVPKTAPVEVLLQAVRKAAEGGKFVTPALAEALAVQLESGLQGSPHETLSNREYQVFCLLAGGKQVSQVAKDLSLSVKTVSTFRSRILIKLGMKTNADMTRYAFKHGLVE